MICCFSLLFIILVLRLSLLAGLSLVANMMDGMEMHLKIIFSTKRSTSMQCYCFAVMVVPNLSSDDSVEPVANGLFKIHETLLQTDCSETLHYLDFIPRCKSYWLKSPVNSVEMGCNGLSVDIELLRLLPALI